MSFYAIRYGYQPYTMPRGRSSRLQRIILRSGYGQPFDNLTADHGHIEGSTDDMRHKAQLPNGKWVSADSTQQLVDTALAQMAPPQQPAAAPLLENEAPRHNCQRLSQRHPASHHSVLRR